MLNWGGFYNGCTWSRLSDLLFMGIRQFCEGEIEDVTNSLRMRKQQRGRVGLVLALLLQRKLKLNIYED